MKKLLTTAAFAVLSFNAMAVEKGDWLLHLRAINVDPNDSSSLIRVDSSGVAGTGIRVDAGQSLDISLGYMFTDKWAVELLADLSSKHSVSAFGLSGSGVPDGTDVVTVNTLPPTLFLQYQFKPTSKIRPYAGVGLNFTTFLNDELTDAARAVLGANNLSLDHSLGLAVQFGIDWELKNDWSFNIDVKYAKIDTTATFDTNIGSVAVDADINPTVFGMGFGKTF